MKKNANCKLHSPSDSIQQNWNFTKPVTTSKPVVSFT